MDDAPITKPLLDNSPISKIFIVILGIAIILGLATGYVLSSRPSDRQGGIVPAQAPKTAEQDSRTFRDFAEGVVKAKPQPSDPTIYVEGTHYLQRDGAVPVALTSSVVDLSKYEGKKVKVYGETQKALKEGWLMDVGRVEEIN